MALQVFQLLRNVGQFDSVTSGAQLPLTKLSLIYGENGRGKTTLAAILRALSTGNSQAVTERKRLGSPDSPHIVIAAQGATFIFQNGAWTNTLQNVSVFDDLFVAQNVCSGLEIEPTHRQNLHELIIGVQGVALNRALQAYAAQIEQHNRNLRTKADAISLTVRGDYSVDSFCALPPAGADIDSKILQAERNLAAAQFANNIGQAAGFSALRLPEFDINAIDELLAKDLPELEIEAALQVQNHLAALGKNGESWVADGMERLHSQPRAGEICPFCAQDLSSAPLIRHYQAYFGQAYGNLKNEIKTTLQTVKSDHAGEMHAAFERSIRAAEQARDFWKSFIAVPEMVIDTAEISRSWKLARQAVQSELEAKQSAPLNAASLSVEAKLLISVFEGHRLLLDQLSKRLIGCNTQIALEREKAGVANAASANSDLSTLRAIKERHSASTASLCTDYLTEQVAKSVTEQLRDQARGSLDQYRQTVFPAYEAAINTYLQRFNAGFRLTSVNAVNIRGGSSCTYSALINNQLVSLSANAGPSFSNVLSAGDRNTLALAFFFASIDLDPHLAQKIVVIDDPMTSLDEHRSLTTIQEIRSLLGRVEQLIVMSHSKAFLCPIWEGADVNTRSAMKISRLGTGSTLTSWDVRQDCITEHDRRHGQVNDYITAHNQDSERTVAAALRPILEVFIRIAYPAAFPPGSLLGNFLNTCRARHATPSELLSVSDTAELRGLLDYSNKFHHDTNPAWETETINDQELTHFCVRTVAFTRRS